MTESVNLGEYEQVIVSGLMNHDSLLWTHCLGQFDVHCEFPFEKLLISVYLLVG